jgi:integrase
MPSGRPRLAYRVKRQGYRNGQPFYDLILPSGAKNRLIATDQAAAELEAARRYQELVDSGAKVHANGGTLKEGFDAYFESETFDLYKPLTRRDRRSAVGLILATPSMTGSHTLADSLLVDWLHMPEAPDAVRRVMALCGQRHAAANHRLKAFDQFFTWLLGGEPQAATARLRFRIGRHATNPCRDVSKAKPKRRRDGVFKSGYTPFTNDQVDAWLTDARDDPAERLVVQLLQMTGARLSDLIRLNRGMIQDMPGGRVLTYTCQKGRDSAFRPPSVAVVPMVPELAAVIDALPADRFVFVHSENGRPFASTEGLGNRIRKWRRAAGLPEGLSAHSMRKAATHWWLRHHRDLIANNFSLKTVFGWATDKELNRYTQDFDRAEEARGMLIRLADRRKQAGG